MKTYLPVSNFAETLEDLFSRVLVFCHADHEADELFEANTGIYCQSFWTTRLDEYLMHLILIIYETKTGKRG
jgi:hypothetical protein